MKTYAIPDQLLGAVMKLLERLHATPDVRGVQNALDNCVAQQNQAEEAAAKANRPAGGGGPGQED